MYIHPPAVIWPWEAPPHLGGDFPVLRLSENPTINPLVMITRRLSVPLKIKGSKDEGSLKTK